MKISDTHPIVGQMLELFRSGKVDEVFLCYTEFVSPLQQEPTVSSCCPRTLFGRRKRKSPPARVC